MRKILLILLMLIMANKAFALSLDSFQQTNYYNQFTDYEVYTQYDNSAIGGFRQITVESTGFALLTTSFYDGNLTMGTLSIEPTSFGKWTLQYGINDNLNLDLNSYKNGYFIIPLTHADHFCQIEIFMRNSLQKEERYVKINVDESNVIIPLSEFDFQNWIIKQISLTVIGKPQGDYGIREFKVENIPEPSTCLTILIVLVFLLKYTHSRVVEMDIPYLPHKQ